MNSAKAGFTLIELLVVIAIVGIISGAVIVQMNGAINATRDATKKTDLSTIKKALMIYQAETGKSYPVETGCTIGSCTNLDVALDGIIPDSIAGSYTYSSDGIDYSVSSILSSGYAYQYNSSTNSFETLEPVAGACGSSDGANLSFQPAENLCNVGTASSVSGSGPWTWNCAGLNGGTVTSCATGGVPVNGACGSANGSNFYSAPTSNLCSTGTASSVSGSGPWTWNCAGENTGSMASCSASLSVNGVCGSSNGANFSSAPTSNLCSTGTASSVSGSGPWTWSCAGINAGTTASCSASIGWNSCQVRFTTSGTSPCAADETTVALSNNSTSQCNTDYFGTNCNNTVNINVGGATKTVSLRIFAEGGCPDNVANIQVGTDALGTGIYAAQNTSTHRPYSSVNWGSRAGWTIVYDGNVINPRGYYSCCFASCASGTCGSAAGTQCAAYAGGLSALCCK